MMILLVIFSCFAISAVVSSLPFLQVMISYFVLCEGFTLSEENEFLHCLFFR